MTLLDRESYGEPDRPIFVFAFSSSQLDMKNSRRTQNRPFEVGDLIGILPPGSETPSIYSLASSSEDGVAEICVRNAQGGLCSTHSSNFSRVRKSGLGWMNAWISSPG